MVNLLDAPNVSYVINFNEDNDFPNSVSIMSKRLVEMKKNDRDLSDNFLLNSNILTCDCVVSNGEYYKIDRNSKLFKKINFNDIRNFKGYFQMDDDSYFDNLSEIDEDGNDLVFSKNELENTMRAYGFQTPENVIHNPFWRSLVGSNLDVLFDYATNISDVLNRKRVMRVGLSPLYSASSHFFPIVMGSVFNNLGNAYRGSRYVKSEN